MAKLSYDEYKGFGGQLSNDAFDKLIARATDAIDTLTLDRYADPLVLLADLASPQFRLRAAKYQKAIAYQVDYYDTLGGTTAAQMNATPTSQSIGGTSVSYGEAVKDATGNVARYATEAYEVLETTGLLYRGVRQCGRFR